MLLQAVAWTSALHAQQGPPSPVNAPTSPAPADQDPAAKQDPAGTRIVAPGQAAGGKQGGQQGQEVQFDEAVLKLKGLPVRAIQMAKAAGGGAPPRVLDAATADPVVRSLETRVGRPFEPRQVSSDCANLWHERRLVVAAWVLEVEGEVVVRFIIEREVETYERVEFRGLVHFDRATVNNLLGLGTDRQITSTEAEAMRKVLLARYRRDGYAFAGIELQERVPDELDDEKSKDATGIPRVEGAARRILFRVDEGPKVTIRNVLMMGNRSFAAEPVFGMFGTDDYLLRDSHIQSDPAWGLKRGGAYSREILEEDLDRLRLFYRGNGFLDATVDLAEVLFSEDRTEADVTFLVVEGPRYRIKSVRIEHVDARGEPTRTAPLYAADEIQKDLKIEPGEFYNHGRLQRDWLGIQEFYGRRGHPASSFPGMEKDPAASRVYYPPSETYGLEPEVDIVFRVYEGVPKNLRDVVIRGNQFTRDAVIRRRIRIAPGDRIDMKEVSRSQRNLDQSRYFDDPVTMRGPRLQFEPVAGEQDLLDLAVDLEDGATGELRWGVGISTGQGAQASITFNKRNFDLVNLPSSANPVTVIREVLDNKAFHGGGQNLNMLLAPGSRFSQFRLAWTDPDIFGEHQDTHELRVAGQRIIRRLPDGYTSDTLGAEVGLSRNFTDEFNVGLSLREDSVRVGSLAPDATSLAFDAEGTTELRGLRLNARYRDYDDLRRPTSGFEIGLSAEMNGGFLGGEESFTKFTHTAQVYVPLGENEMGHRTVLHLEHLLGTAQAFGGSDDVFLTERFYMGGSNLRGFSYRGAGPKQFNRPVGGEVTYTATAELSFPLIATRLENEIRDRELLRWVMFTDIGLLGLSTSDSTFGELRGSSGVGLRIEVPLLELPISLDLAWPWQFEESDDRRQFYFSIAR
ncbi:MAG: BamA/TamA family outer membrane protein [Planctomycetes bacterium]|nr:BamA/TamA family outer membrane protein [Planctomycetota bacterium]